MRFNPVEYARVLYEKKATRYKVSQDQISELILQDPDGGSMLIVSDLETLADNSVRFEVANPDTGRRFGVVLGLTELTPLFEEPT